MPTNYTGRVAVIIIVVLIALLGIFPIHKLMDPSLPWSKKIGLNPGIDIAGGTKLLYEIKAPPDANLSQNNLAEEVAKILKQRVDPNGVMNYVWRPQGNTRLEIQIPHNPAAEHNDAIKKAFIDAQETLNSFNLRRVTVQTAIEKFSDTQQQKMLVDLSRGDPARQQLFDKLLALYHTKTTSTDPQTQAQADIDYDAALAQVEQNNIYPDALEDVLQLPPEDRATQLKAIQEKAAAFPAQAEALKNFIAAFDAKDSLKNSPDDVSEFKRKLQGSGVLEFHILVASAQGDPAVQAMVTQLHTRGPNPRAGDTMRWYVLAKEGERVGGVTQEFNKKTYVLAYTDPFVKPGNQDTDPPKAMIHSPTIPAWGLQDAAGETDPSTGGKDVRFEFDNQGASYFSALTGANHDKPLGIVLDDRLISAPNINSTIGKVGTITSGDPGGFSPDELDFLVSTLKAGSLPAQLGDIPISEVSIGPSVGAENLHRGLIASLIGLIVVGVFLVGYYFIPGIVATVAVGMNLIIILGSLALVFNATFTLPGIAGIALTVGMAVDANVLIFERFREEKHRGLSTKMALRNAYDRAFTAILDSNVTTAITSIVLYAIGSEEVKGFGLTLLIGILSSLFTALFVTKTIFAIMIDKFGFDNFSSIPSVIPKWDKLLHPKIDWMSKAWIFVTFSCIMLIGGLYCFFAQGSQMFDIEFVSGSSVEFKLKDQATGTQVQDWLDSEKQTLPSMNVTSVGDSGQEFEVVTPNLDVNHVRDAILRALTGKLLLEEPSRFQGWDEDPSQAIQQGLIVPIKNASLTSADGMEIPKAAEYDGGAAIMLNNISPTLTIQQLQQRLDAARLQEGYTHANWSVDVERVDGSPNRNEPVDHAVVMVADPNTQYDEASDPAKEAWRSRLAEAAWKDLVVPGIHSDVKLEQVTKFDKQVAGAAQWDAILATVLSVVIIMIYIWVRFGNMKYGAATVIAMLHDTLLTVGFIGISHYIAYGPIGKALLVDAFRVNLTLVAAVLTIMSYSMIDTVVVFDRIRENRGRFGYISKQVINDSINQTLSRTLLTCSTTIFTVATMYIFGGPGIHGFTFVLLVGILVGTYSSIAIAAPLLLVGGTKTVDAGRKPPIGAVQRAGA